MDFSRTGGNSRVGLHQSSRENENEISNFFTMRFLPDYGPDYELRLKGYFDKVSFICPPDFLFLCGSVQSEQNQDNDA
jgi:hypothetical protein